MAKINGSVVKSVEQSVFGVGRGRNNKVMSLPLDKAFHMAQSGAIVNVTVGASKYTAAYTGMVRVERSLGRSGRPALFENTDWNLPTGSITLTVRKLNGSGETFAINWRRDCESIAEFDIQGIPAVKEEKDTVTHKAWTHAQVVPSVSIVTPETHQLPSATIVPDSTLDYIGNLLAELNVAGLIEA